MHCLHLTLLSREENDRTHLIGIFTQFRRDDRMCAMFSLIKFRWNWQCLSHTDTNPLCSYLCVRGDRRQLLPYEYVNLISKCRNSQNAFHRRCAGSGADIRWYKQNMQTVSFEPIYYCLCMAPENAPWPISLTGNGEWMTGFFIFTIHKWRRRPTGWRWFFQNIIINRMKWRRWTDTLVRIPINARSVILFKFH